MLDHLPPPHPWGKLKLAASREQTRGAAVIFQRVKNLLDYLV
jgi:hypothetical protein